MIQVVTKATDKIVAYHYVNILLIICAITSNVKNKPVDDDTEYFYCNIVNDYLKFPDVVMAKFILCINRSKKRS